MLSNLDCSILKELDRQNIKSDVISVVMNRLDTNDKKNDFLSFMIDNRNVLISLKDIFSEYANKKDLEAIATHKENSINEINRLNNEIIKYDKKIESVTTALKDIYIDKSK